MGVTAVLVLVALVMLLVAPSVLSLGAWRVRLPRTALALWFGAFLTGCACAAASVGTAVVGATARPDGPAHTGVLVTLAAWLGLGLLGGVLALVSVSAEPFAGLERRVARALSGPAATRQRRPGFTLVRFPADRPVACAVPGRHPEILVSSALEGLLSPPQLQAVLAHERAHLRQRHAWAVRVAEVNALCLPRGLRAGDDLRRETRFLVELAADDAAARDAGPAHLANALVRLGEATGDVGMVLRARRLEGRRWSPRRRLPEALAAWAAEA